MMPRLLLVEDDPRVRRVLTLALRTEGLDVQEASSGADALAAAAEQPLDLVLLDLTLPDLDGLEVCRRFRRHSDVPVIMVTARSDSQDVIAGLEAGADDYVTKPVVARELTLRVRALLRRSGATQAPPPITIGELELLPAEGTLRRGDEEVHLTRTEFRLLCELASQPGTVLTREQLLERVWDYDYFGDTRLLDVHMHRLRRKVERTPDAPRHILTVRGTGYRLQV